MQCQGFSFPPKEKRQEERETRHFQEFMLGLVFFLHPFPVETLDKPMKKRVIPKIVVTGPFDDEMSSTSVDDLPESKTIRDIADSGSYNVHTKPSTIEAYQVRKEAA
uniref:Uncharacterized protein n=1 Tax=Chelonoidis abingdonii TaxID=106734 RepID=A0A8C0GDM7_CHEAB